jgi:hypothetical protein
VELNHKPQGLLGSFKAIELFLSLYTGQGVSFLKFSVSQFVLDVRWKLMPELSSFNITTKHTEPLLNPSADMRSKQYIGNLSDLSL